MNDITSQAIGDHAFHRNLHQAQIRSGFAAFLLWFFLGSFGAHLMYLRRWTMLIFHYAMAVLTVVAIVMVFRNNNIHSLGVGLAALWMAFIPVGIYNFGGLCILFPQVNYCNEDSALRLAGRKTERARMPERLLILFAGGAMAIFIGAMSTSPSANYSTSSTTPNAVAPTPAVQQVNPLSASSAPSANVDQGNVQPQANATEAASQVTTVADAAPAQEQQASAPTEAQATQPTATQPSDPATDLNTTPNQVYGTSFDCAKSHSQNEYLICHTPALAAADVKLANAVTSAKNAIAPADLDAFKDRMRGQWNFREKHCNDVACLNTWYQYQTNTMALIEQTKNVAARVESPQN
ncbi:hypothetical protein [Paraburkholderia caribensis]|uniref:hypothetical protein n=1 Tax=Paraburkholderia caribensis TaxID=75105 RepID=UPI0020913391|nr:hypothetical protein [Paraburkholderia caribensis]MCO4879037.1 hypothetical protein [Paraburkholderia caribensis]